MKIDTKTMLEAFEETGGRGDVLSIPRKDLVQLATVPFKRFAPIFHQLFKWFVDGDNTPLKDPLANAMLERLKVQQLENARRRKAFLVRQADLSKKGVEARQRNANGNPWVISGQPMGNPTVTQTKPKPKPKPEPKLEQRESLGSVGDGASRAIAAPPTPISVKEAQKFLAMNAPQISTLPGMRTAKGQATVLCMTLIDGEIDKAVKAAGNRILDRETEDDYEGTYNTFDAPIISMAERMDAIGKESEFRRILAKAMVDSEADEVDNQAAFVMARCKKGMAAILATAGK